MANIYINTGKTVKLADLIQSNDIDDKAILCIYDEEGRYVLGATRNDKRLLEYADRIGMASKKPGGFQVNHRVMFRLV